MSLNYPNKTLSWKQKPFLIFWYFQQCRVDTYSPSSLLSIWPREECLLEQLQCWSGNQSPGECDKWQSLKPPLRTKSNRPTAWALVNWVRCGRTYSSVPYKACAEKCHLKDVLFLIPSFTLYCATTESKQFNVKINKTLFCPIKSHQLLEQKKGIPGPHMNETISSSLWSSCLDHTGWKKRSWGPKVLA